MSTSPSSSSDEDSPSPPPQSHTSPAAVYRHRDKPKARGCGHFTFSWDNHESCVSCCLWKGLGPWQGLPCLKEGSFCKFCRYWSPALREKYQTAIRARVSCPHKFSAGSKYLAEHNINAPKPVMAFLGYNTAASSSGSEEPLIEDSSAEEPLDEELGSPPDQGDTECPIAGGNGSTGGAAMGSGELLRGGVPVSAISADSGSQAPQATETLSWLGEGDYQHPHTSSGSTVPSGAGTIGSQTLLAPSSAGYPPIPGSIGVSVPPRGSPRQLGPPRPRSGSRVLSRVEVPSHPAVPTVTSSQVGGLSLPEPVASTSGVAAGSAAEQWLSDPLSQVFSGHAGPSRRHKHSKKRKHTRREDSSDSEEAKSSKRKKKHRKHKQEA